MDVIKPLTRRSSYRDELCIHDDTFVVLYAGNVGQKQGLAILFGAAERLVSESGLLFVIAGDGPEKAHLVEKYNALPNVCFLPVQPEERLCDLLNLANVHILPQERGATDLVLPSKIGGMLASGRPSLVLADEGTELYEFLQGAVILIPPGDVSRLAIEIQKIAKGDAKIDCDLSLALAQKLSRNKVLPTFGKKLLIDEVTCPHG